MDPAPDLSETGATRVAGTRFGFVLGQQRATFDSYVRQWQAAEAIEGIDVGYVFDHFAPESGSGRSSWFDAYATLASLAVITTRLRLGVLVTGVALRHPAQIAKSAVTIDHASGGRLELGLGAGGAEVDHAYFGLKMPPLGERIATLSEAIPLIRRFFVEEIVDFDGSVFTARDVTADPKPVQRRVPIWVGGNSDGVVRLAGELADGWNCYRMDPDRYRSRLEVLSEGCATAGRNRDDLDQSLVVKIVPADSRRAFDRQVRRLADRSGLPVDQVANSVVAGSASDWIEQLLPYHALGVREFVVDLEADQQAENAALLEHVAAEIVPAFNPIEEVSQ
jgi:alkanesulfonate monooxygenase SsuD/methylene tetrahydromethanopterin reductase-like flavin-dependent oxidoreductase (luciferase family)